MKDLVVLFPEDDESIQMVTTGINLAIVDDDDNKIIIREDVNPGSHEMDNVTLSILDKEPNEYTGETSIDFENIEELESIIREFKNFRNKLQFK